MKHPSRRSLLAQYGFFSLLIIFSGVRVIVTYDLESVPLVLFVLLTIAILGVFTWITIKKITDIKKRDQ